MATLDPLRPVHGRMISTCGMQGATDTAARQRARAPHGQLVPLGSGRRRPCTCGLSTWWSPTALQREDSSRGGLRAYMPSALIPSGLGYPAVPLAGQLAHQRSVRPGPLVLGTAPPSPLAPATDRDRTVSRRSEPSSRATLMGEQPNPWDLLQPQDVTSRHRGAKPPRRCELLGEISLLSPEYLLSFERWPFHAEPPDHYALLSYLIDLYVSQSSSLMPLHSTHGYQAC